METLLSVIVPSYNVAAKITKCFESLDKLFAQVSSLEVIFVDDCSTDGSFSEIIGFAGKRSWVKVTQTAENSGGPSAPRNIGLSFAKGKYIFYLDGDDEISFQGVMSEIEVAEATGADIVRAPLIRDDGRQQVVMNRIEDWLPAEDRLSRVKKIVENHSTTVCGLYRRSFLVNLGLDWPVDLRLAEDAIFLYSALVTAEVQYSDEPDFVYNVALIGDNASSTQQYQERELSNHLLAWERADEILWKIGIDYFALRGQIALQAAFQNMIRFNRGGLSRVSFNRLSSFLQKREDVVRRFDYGPRFAELRDLVLANDYEMFLEGIKIRLLIAGYDLRFILPAVTYLSEFYQVQVDEWSGHESHDEVKSRRLLNWADSIHCEWMLGNAVWYSKNKSSRQSLLVRLHRFETSRDYGHQLEVENVDKFVTIAPGMFEEMQGVFGFPRERVTYIPNYIETEDYIQSDDSSKIFNLVMVGSIPIRKGYYRALELVKSLHEIDSRYNLTVYGKRPDELGWVIRDPLEREYFESCDRFIRNNGLESVVQFGGWVNTKEALADKGFVLSLSDAEGSHVAAAEGFAARNITLLRPWSGAKYMYPSQYIISSIGEMREYILECRDYGEFERRSESGYLYVEENYSVSRFLELYTEAMPAPYSVP